MSIPSAKVNDIFEQAIKLMDEQSDSGMAIWSDTTEYQHRTIAILNVLLGECYPYSDTYTAAVPGKRPVAAPVFDMDDVVQVDDGLAKSVLPYGLAAELIKNDDPALGTYFIQRYRELLAQHGRSLPAVWESAEDIYGVAGHSSFARW